MADDLKLVIPSESPSPNDTQKNKKDNSEGFAIAFTPAPPSQAPSQANNDVPLIHLMEQPSEEKKSSQVPPNLTNGATTNAATNNAQASFENIFAQPKGEKADLQKDSKIITSIIAEKKPSKSILGPVPLLKESLEEEKLAKTKKQLRLVQLVFTLIFLFTLGTIFYFYTRLSPSFDLLGTNLTQQLTDVNANLRKLKTDLNKYRYLHIQLKLDEFSYQADRFFGSVQHYYESSASAGEKTEALANLEEAKRMMPALISDIKALLQEQLIVETFPAQDESAQSADDIKRQFENTLRASLQEDRKKFVSSAGLEDMQNIKLLDNAVKLVGNQAFVKNIQQLSLENFMGALEEYEKAPDVQKEKDLRATVSKVLGSTQSDLALIADLKQKRIEWSSIIKQIEMETKNVDKNYGQPLLYEKIGGILYTGYEFDSITNKIVLSGTTRTSDGSNFTLISNLIDQLEQSLHFEDVDDRSYSKAKFGDLNEGYTMNFKIDLRLESGFSDKNKALSLESTPSAQTGIKR